MWAAFSTARRALVSSLSSGGRCVPPLAEASRRRSNASSSSSSTIDSRRSASEAKLLTATPRRADPSDVSPTLRARSANPGDACCNPGLRWPASLHPIVATPDRSLPACGRGSDQLTQARAPSRHRLRRNRLHRRPTRPRRQSGRSAYEPADAPSARGASGMGLAQSPHHHAAAMTAGDQSDPRSIHGYRTLWQ